ncbi:MAG: YihA family ribosome biogenesis GTP-binding protein [Candidatus Hydrogenedens sp.]|nr:YihA family ribosome biogenesis GTP-binding protein [Candidatus Hydrogenedens sp.]
MKPWKVSFVKSALLPEDYPKDRRPECAFVGRSNVGKSSLLNTLFNQKGLAKTSSTPGKTQTLNYFDVNGKAYLVDLPGYGFAKVPKALKEEWNRYMWAYLRERETLKLVVALVDARHKPSALDAEMLALLDEAAVPTLLVATKIDKLKQSERRDNLRRIRHTLDLHPEAELLPFSSVNREGLPALRAIIAEQIGL